MKKTLLVAMLVFVSGNGLQAQVSTVGTTKASSTDGSRQWSVAITPLAGDTLVVGCDFNTGISFSSLSDSAGDTFTQIGAEADSPSIASRAFIATNVRGGSTTVTCSAASAPSNTEIYVTELKGVNSFAPVDKLLSVAGSSGSASGTLTTTNPNEFLWAYIMSGTVTNATGWTSLSTFDSNLITSKLQATPGAVAAKFTVTRDWTLIVLALNPAASDASDSPAISLSVAPVSTSVQVSKSSLFTATLQNDSPAKGVTWSLSGSGCSGAACGALSNATSTTVTYTAPASVPSPGTVQLLATSVADTTKSASSTITISPAPAISVSVTPPTASVQMNQSVPFTASLQNDSLGKGVTWSLAGSGCAGANCGTLTNVTSSSATYNAPALVPTPATISLVATSAADTTKSATATITVAPAPAISVAVTPPSLTVSINQPSSFAATLQNDSLGKGVSWLLSGTACSGTSCGSLTNITSTSVTYTAPATAPTPPTVTLLATSIADSSKSASAAITINSAVPQSTITTVGTTQAASNDGSRQWSVAVAPIAGDTLLVGCDFNAGISFTGVSDSAGDVFSQIAPEADSPSIGARAYIAPNARGGATTVTCTAASAASNNEIYVTELKGVNPAAPIDKFLSIAGSSGSATGSLTTTNPNEFLWAYVISGTVTNATGWTSLSAFDSNLVTSKTQATPAAVPATFRVTRDWTLVYVALNPLGAGSPAPGISVSVSPGSPSVQVLTSTTFTATLQNDPLNKGVTWALSGAGCSGVACGTLTNVTTTSATYTAPTAVPVPATVTLVATSVADATKSSSTTITVVAAPVISVSVTPPTTTLQVGQSIPFSATLQNDSLLKGVSWGLSGAGCSGAACGTLTNVTTTSVTYTAPLSAPNPSIVSLKAISLADSTKSFSATISISSAAQVSVAVSPKRGSVTLTQPLQFTATVTGDSQSLGVTWSVDGTSGGSSSSGSISSSGLFSPSSSTSPGSHSITATSVADPTQSASVSIAVTDLPGIFTHHYDSQRTGQNLKEYALSPSSLSSSTFGALFSCSVNENGSVPGYVYAQPLYVASLTMADSKKHNVVFVATESDFVYAFDADSSPCQLLWKTSMLKAGETTVPAADTGETGDLVPEIGVTSTPVIDPSSNTLYVCAKSKDSSSNYHHRLHALNLSTGAEILGGPVDITASGFNVLAHMQRPALLLGGSTIYISFGSHGDHNTYHGWLMGYNKTTLTQSFVWASTDLSSNTEGALWGAGTGPALDSSGNIWVETANGNFDGTINFGDSVVKLSSSGSVLDFFTPSYQDTLRANDVDLGSGGVLILPDSAASPSHPHLAVATGKPGGFYLLDQSNLGHFNSSSDNIVQELFPQSLNTTSIGGGVFGQTAFWNGNLYISVIGDSLRQFTISNASISNVSSSNSSHTFSYPAVIPVISANGSSGGIVWGLEIGGYSPSSPVILHAFNASNLASELFTSPSSGSAAAGTAVKFSVPTVANGKVYVGGQGSLTVFGLLPN